MRKIKPTPLLSLRDSNVYLFDGNMAVNGKLYKANGDIEDYPIPFVNTSFNWNSNKLQSSTTGIGPLFLADVGVTADTSKRNSSLLRARTWMSEGYIAFNLFGLNNKFNFVRRRGNDDPIMYHPNGPVRLGAVKAEPITPTLNLYDSTNQGLTGNPSSNSFSTALDEIASGFTNLTSPRSEHGLYVANRTSLFNSNTEQDTRTLVGNFPNTGGRVRRVERVGEYYVVTTERAPRSNASTATNTLSFLGSGDVNLGLISVLHIVDRNFNILHKVDLIRAPHYGGGSNLPLHPFSPGTYYVPRCMGISSVREDERFVTSYTIVPETGEDVSNMQIVGLRLYRLDYDTQENEPRTFMYEFKDEEGNPLIFGDYEYNNQGLPLSEVGTISSTNNVGVVHWHLTNTYKLEGKLYCTFMSCGTGYTTRNEKTYNPNHVEYTFELEEPDETTENIQVRNVSGEEFVTFSELGTLYGLSSMANVSSGGDWLEFQDGDYVYRIATSNMTSSASWSNLNDRGYFDLPETLVVDGVEWETVQLDHTNGILTGPRTRSALSLLIYDIVNSNPWLSFSFQEFATTTENLWTSFTRETSSTSGSFSSRGYRPIFRRKLKRCSATLVAKRVRRGVFGMQGQSLYTYAEHEGTLYCITDDYIVPVKFDPVTKLHEIAGPLIDVNAVSIHISETGDLRIVDADFKLYHMKANQSDTVRLKANDITFDGEEHEGSIEVTAVNYKGEMIQARVELALSGPLKFENGSNRLLIITNDSEPVTVPVIITDYGSIDVTATSVS